MADTEPQPDSILTELTTRMTKVLNKASVPTLTSDTSAAPIGIKLDGTNYALWSQVVEMYISSKDNLGFINGEFPQPPQTIHSFGNGARTMPMVPSFTKNDFRDYTEVCFKEFGDRVKHWITLNEPTSYSVGGYTSGAIPPGRCSDWQNQFCTKGNSGTEPYLVIHHQLLAHAAAVKAYRQKYQEKQNGTIGVSLETGWMVPYSKARHHRNAMLRALDFRIGWLMDPLINGYYPHSMRSLVGSRLPKFTKEQSKLVNRSFDFIGLNYYTAYYAAYAPQHNAGNASYLTDSRTNLLTERNGIPIGPQAASEWLHLYPRGIRDLLLYTKQKYHNPLIYITENGIDEFNNAHLSLEEALVDNQRIEYYYSHLWYLHKAIMDGVNVKGYFAWSLLDNFEWNSGYTVRFGINYIDYKDGLKRHPKLSAHWFTNFLKK